MLYLTCLGTKENAWTKGLWCGVSQSKSMGKGGDRAWHYNTIYDLDLHSPTTFSSPTKRCRSGWAATHDTLLVKIWENVFPFLASASPQTSRSEASCTASHLSLSKLSSWFSAFASLPCSQPIVHRWAQGWYSWINPQHTEYDFYPLPFGLLWKFNSKYTFIPHSLLIPYDLWQRNHLYVLLF